MPLRETEDPASIESVNGATEDFLIFYSSRDAGGKLWCPDCVAVEDLIFQRFGETDAPTGLIVYVGQRAEWKAASNIFRGAPWQVGSIPTIVRTKDGVRLVEEEIIHGLATLFS